MFLAADVGGTPRSRANSAHEGKGVPFVQSGGSSPQSGTPPRMVGVAPPTVGLSNEGRPANRAMQPSNQEASGEERDRSHLTRGTKNGRGDDAVWVCLAWCRLIRLEAFSALIACRLVVSRLVRLITGWRPSLYPSSQVIGAALRQWVRVPSSQLDQTARGGQVQVQALALSSPSLPS